MQSQKWQGQPKLLAFRPDSHNLYEPSTQLIQNRQLAPIPIDPVQPPHPNCTIQMLDVTIMQEESTVQQRLLRFEKEVSNFD